MDSAVNPQHSTTSTPSPTTDDAGRPTLPTQASPSIPSTSVLSPDVAASASALLLEAWSQGHTMPELPTAVRPTTRAQGYAIQQRLEAHTSGVPGWKIAATSADGQRHIGVDGPLAGRVLAESVLPAGAPVSLDRNRFAMAELEFAFEMNRDFAPRPEPYSAEEVLAGAGRLLLSFEFPSTRFDDPAVVGAPQLIADNASGHQLCLRPAATQDWKQTDLSAVLVRVTATADGQPSVVRDGLGGNALGDPRTALVWLVNELSGHGIELSAGQFVTTGTCVEPLPVRPGDTVTGDWGVFGSFTVQVAPAGAAN